MANQELFDRVLTRIADDPESFDVMAWFGTYSCKTVACIAGHTALELGWQPYSQTGANCVKDGEVRKAADVAREALNLTHRQAWRLFTVQLPFEEHEPRTVEDVSMRWKVVVLDG